VDTKDVVVGAGVAAAAGAAGLLLLRWREQRTGRGGRQRRRPVAVVWLGPVDLSQVVGAELPGVRSVNLPCTGDGTPSCGQIADAWAAGGRRLPALRRALRLPEGPLVLAAYSAGGHAVKRVLSSPEDRRDVVGVSLADATYTTSWEDERRRLAAPIGPFVDYAAEALDGSRLFVATASAAPNKAHPTGAESLDAVRRGVERAGARWAPGRAPLGAERSWFSGGVRLLDFGSRHKHGEHATVLAPAIWRAMVQPFFG
jgi:hypothetical protein